MLVTITIDLACSQFLGHNLNRVLGEVLNEAKSIANGCVHNHDHDEGTWTLRWHHAGGWDTIVGSITLQEN